MRRLRRLTVSATVFEVGARFKVLTVAISLIPYTYHALVIKSAIRKKVNVVTTSYISESMESLRGEIDEAGITVMNEIGVCAPLHLKSSRS